MDEVTCLSKMRAMGFRFPVKATGTFGIEIETETKSAGDYPEGFFKEDTSSGHLRFRVPMSEWEGHVDNSLRNYGMEYVLRKPLTFDDVMPALDSFSQHTKSVKFIQNAPSTSVHVHVNMLHERPSTMANFMALYTLFENVLVDYSGESRRSNLFALPIRVASATVDNMRDIIQMFRDEDFSLWRLNAASAKYAALNLAPLSTFGSLELRSFRGETDVNEIKDWIRIINSLLTYAQTPGLTPRIVMFEYKMRGVSYFDEVFKGMAEKIRSRVNDISELIERNLWYLYKIATSVDDWEAMDQMKEKEKVVLKKKAPLTVNDFGQIAEWTPSNVPPTTLTAIVDDFENQHEEDDYE